MKKILVVVATLILVMTCAMMVACGGVEGKYYAKSYTSQGQTIEATDEQAKSYIKLGSDNKLYMGVDGSEEEEIGTWKKAEEGEDKYVLSSTLMGGDVDVTISGGTLTVKQNGYESVYKK